MPDFDPVHYGYHQDPNAPISGNSESEEPTLHVNIRAKAKQIMESLRQISATLQEGYVLGERVSLANTATPSLRTLNPKSVDSILSGKTALEELDQLSQLDQELYDLELLREYFKNSEEVPFENKPIMVISDFKEVEDLLRKEIEAFIKNGFIKKAEHERVILDVSKLKSYSAGPFTVDNAERELFRQLNRLSVDILRLEMMALDNFTTQAGLLPLDALTKAKDFLSETFIIKCNKIINDHKLYTVSFLQNTKYELCTNWKSLLNSKEYKRFRENTLSGALEISEKLIYLSTLSFLHAFSILEERGIAKDPPNLQSRAALVKVQILLDKLASQTITGEEKTHLIGELHNEFQFLLFSYDLIENNFVEAELLSHLKFQVDAGGNKMILHGLPHVRGNEASCMTSILESVRAELNQSAPKIVRLMNIPSPTFEKLSNIPTLEENGNVFDVVVCQFPVDNPKLLNDSISKCYFSQDKKYSDQLTVVVDASWSNEVGQEKLKDLIHKVLSHRLTNRLIEIGKLNIIFTFSTENFSEIDLGEQNSMVAVSYHSENSFKKFDETMTKWVRGVARSSDSISYYDQNALLLTPSSAGSKMNPLHRNWHYHQALLQDALRLTSDPQTVKALQQLILNGFARASKSSSDRESFYNVQGTPLESKEAYYHRFNSNLEQLTHLQTAVKHKLGLQQYEVFLINSPSITEIIQSYRIDYVRVNQDTIEDQIDNVFKQHVKNVYEKSTIAFNFKVLDFSSSSSGEPQSILVKTTLIHQAMNILASKIKEYEKRYPDINFEYLASHMQFIFVFQQPFGTMLLHAFNLIDDIRRMDFTETLKQIITTNGYRPSPDQLRGIEVELFGLSQVTAPLPQSALPLEKSHTESIKTVGSNSLDVVEKFSLKKSQALHDFRKLANNLEYPPYVRVLSQSTCELIDGLQDLNIEQIFQDKELTPLLESIYTRMIDAIGMAMLKKDDMVQFNNQINVIHQYIQDILTLTSPYNKNAFQKIVTDRICDETHGIVPSDLRAGSFSKVYLKHSAMYTMSNIIKAIQDQKDSRALNMSIMKGCYFEQSYLFSQLVTCSKMDVDGKTLEQGIPQDIDQLNLPIPLDLYVCEPQHSFTVATVNYEKMDVVSQIKALENAGVFAIQFTVVVDITSNQESDMQSILADKDLIKWIREGRMNLVFIQSGQKYSMFGLDNYYGAIAISFNHEMNFAKFNYRMGLSEDQLSGISYQGMTHIQKYASRSIDLYKNEVQKNTHYLYKLISEGAPQIIGNTSAPFHLAVKSNDQMVFLDFKFDYRDYRMVGDYIYNALTDFSKKKGLYLSKRPSFGFIQSNTMYLSSGQGNTALRFTPGLEGIEVMNAYGAFFKKFGEVVEKGQAEELTLGRKLNDYEWCVRFAAAYADLVK